MTKEKILAIMEDSEGRKVEVIDAKNETFVGVVDLFESRYDNSDDEEPYTGEASICIDCDDDICCELYESDIKEIKITE